MRNKIILLCLILLAWSTACFAQLTTDKAGMALGPDDSVYVINQYSDEVAIVEKYSAQGKFLKNIYPGELKEDPLEGFPSIATDSAGNLYVANTPYDSLPEHITKYNPSGKKIDSFLMKKGDSGTSIAVDKRDKINVLTCNPLSYIEQFDQSAKKHKMHVIRLPKSVNDQDLRGLAIGANGKFFVGDDMNSCIYILSSTGKYIDAITPTKNWWGFSFMATDSKGNLYVGVYRDPNNIRTMSIQKYDPSGKYLMTFSDAVVRDSNLIGIAVNSTGDVFTYDEHRIVRRYNPKGKLLTKWKMRTKLP
jgi:hypothetical protein